MLPAFLLALTLTGAPLPAPEISSTLAGLTLAQQKPVPPAPRRDCEKNSEGIS